MALPGSSLIRFGRRAASSDAVAPDATAGELLGVLPTPFLVIDAEGRVVDANAASESLLNMSRAALIGRSIGETIGLRLDAIAADAPFVGYDMDVALPGGRSLVADVAAAPLPDRPGWRMITIHSRAPAHLAARRADREGGKRAAVGAAAMLAHEIKNPLSAIRGAAQLLDGGGTRGEEGGELTQLIRAEVDRITLLIDRMEGFTDTRPIALAAQNIHAILGHARDVAQAGFGAGLAIRELYDPSLPAVLGDRDTLVQILINLLKNAGEALGGTGIVTLTTRYRHGVSMVTQGGGGRRSLPIEVCVIDEGPGAPPHIAELLFDPFVTSKHGGSGLGLALVQKLVGDQGGIVEYAREGVPPRTVFRVLLQRAART